MSRGPGTPPGDTLSWTPAARGIALFLGAFSLLNLLGELRHPGFDANLWWIDFRPLAEVPSDVFLALASALLLAYGLAPNPAPRRRRASLLCVDLLLVLTLWNTVSAGLLAARRAIAMGFPLPLSALIAAALALVDRALRRAPREHGPRSCAIAAAAFAACALLFPLAQMFCFGKTDYRRPARAIVVFGSRAYADGRPSQSLGDRMGTACELYRAGLGELLLVSGGPGDGAFHETDVMRRLALEAGVPAQAILVDREGLNTFATVRNSIPMLEAKGSRRVLAVSHFYHLPRIKLAYQRQGWEVYTVPARETRLLLKMPYFILREIAALWAYYLRPLAP